MTHSLSASSIGRIGEDLAIQADLEEPEVPNLESLSRRMRAAVLRMIHDAGSGHIGSSLSAVDVMAVLRFDQMRWSRGPGRDVFVLSKGHAAPAWYAALLVGGDLDAGLVSTLRTLDSPLQGHPDRARCEFVDVSTGALGQGLSVAIGRAQGRRLRDGGGHAYCLAGDGECQEGQVWEGVMYAGARGVSNLTLVIDANGRQSDGTVESTLPLDSLAEKLTAFRWSVREVNGHSHDELRQAFSAARREHRRPTAVIAHTQKGYLGPDRAPLLGGSHSGLLKPDELEESLRYLRVAR
ncbi:transketolase [Streptomyces sp. NPDC049879]|uniref:transketolase n=1 Tax=Streptomyces sp. NPDC049879 TaxID=3365598 RepID=UPI00379DE32F